MADAVGGRCLQRRPGWCLAPHSGTGRGLGVFFSKVRHAGKRGEKWGKPMGKYRKI